MTARPALAPENGQPLAGLRVLDMTSLAMGPLAGQILGDYGADVIKVEPPAGDAFRHTLPTRSPAMGHVYLQFNRNKRSLAIDLKAKATQEPFRRLIEGADILVSNMRPAAMAGLRLDYDTVRAVNPAIIYCAAYGFSESGPYAGRPAADDTIQAMSGMAELQGRIPGEPQLVASVVADKAAGLTLANAVMAAIIHRMKTGRGQFIEVAMFETMVAFVLPEHLGGLAYEPANGPSGYARIINPSRKPYATADGHLTVLPYTTPQWQRFFRLIGRDDLAADPDLKDPVRRNARVQELYALIEAVMPSRTTKEWVADLLAADILFGEVMSPEELVADPHLSAMNLFAMVDHPTEGRIRLMNPPVQSSEGATKLVRLPPTLGQHSAEILREIGLGEAEIAELQRAGHIVIGPSTAATKENHNA
jgi:crotonobetainyl-CoA:carnitine CoA-transferase CaiB-like acyl-CoA transferase